MAVVQDEFNAALNAAPLADPAVPVVGNVSAAPLASAADVRADLGAQLTSRVRWTESIQWMLAQGVAAFVEIGSGNVLTGLLKRIDRSAGRIALGAPQDFENL